MVYHDTRARDILVSRDGTKSMSAEGRRTSYLRGWITGSPRIGRVSDRSGYAMPRDFHRERSSL